MDKPIPDKWIRKAIDEAINNMSVLNEDTGETIQIPCFDSRVPSDKIVDHYILMTTQTNQTNRLTKCEDSYDSSILLDIITSFYGSGNFGDRSLADNILDKARDLTKNLTLDVSSGLKILRQTQNFPNDIVTITPTENVFRKLMRIELFIN
jgi:hypothetical protein